MKLTIKQDSHNPTLWRISHGHHVVKVSSVYRPRNPEAFEVWFGEQEFHLTSKMYLELDSAWLDMLLKQWKRMERIAMT